MGVFLRSVSYKLWHNNYSNQRHWMCSPLTCKSSDVTSHLNVSLVCDRTWIAYHKNHMCMVSLLCASYCEDEDILAWWILYITLEGTIPNMCPEMYSQVGWLTKVFATDAAFIRFPPECVTPCIRRCDWSIYHRCHICMVSLLCVSLYVSALCLSGWTPYHRNHICRASLRCGIENASLVWKMYWIPCHKHHT